MRFARITKYKLHVGERKKSSAERLLSDVWVCIVEYDLRFTKRKRNGLPIRNIVLFYWLCSLFSVFLCILLSWKYFFCVMHATLRASIPLTIRYTRFFLCFICGFLYGDFFFRRALFSTSETHMRIQSEPNFTRHCFPHTALRCFLFILLWKLIIILFWPIRLFMVVSLCCTTLSIKLGENLNCARTFAQTYKICQTQTKEYSQQNNEATENECGGRGEKKVAMGKKRNKKKKKLKKNKNKNGNT